ncbi:MAG: metallophosphoesterase [Lachnospiraceae bacterium]|nr:metallophosphoesterase [Lachnospiraceae bacterium]
MIYLTGDTHGDFRRIKDFCDRFNTTKDDIMIILGDAGINFFGGIKDIKTKEYISTLPITLFCVHGNHERRPFTIMSYIEEEWNGGIVYMEDIYPNILFAKDGEIYDLMGLKTMALGGAYSIDKDMRIEHGYGWWSDEQPSLEIRQFVDKQLKDCKWDIDVFLSHTVPRKYEPTEVYLRGIDESKVDKSTEVWLDSIENKTHERYLHWYAGHFHIDKSVEKLQILFKSYEGWPV